MWLKALSVFLTVCFLFTSTASAGWLSGYDYRHKITIDSTKADATESDFPILVKLDETDVTNTDWQDTTNYYDTRFTSSNGTTQIDFDRVIQTHSTQDVSTNLIAHYLMNDNAASTVVLDNIGSFNGTLVGGDNTDAINGTGKINGDLIFDGTNDYINLGDVNLADGNNDVSIGVWFKTTSVSTTQWLFDFGTHSTRQALLATITNTGFVRFGTWGDDMDSIQTIVADTWLHLFCTYNATGNIRKIYINGALNNTGTLGADLNLQGTAYSIGTRNGGGDKFGGEVDDFRIYERTLTDEEVLAIYNRGNGTESESSTLPVTDMVLYSEIPSISSSSDTDFYMYYGKSGDSNGEDKGGTWANGEGIYHLVDDAASTAVVDSSGNSRDGTHGGNTDGDSINSGIYRSLSFSNNRHTTLPNTLIQSTSLITISWRGNLDVSTNNFPFRAINSSSETIIQSNAPSSGSFIVDSGSAGSVDVISATDGIDPTDGVHAYHFTKDTVAGLTFLYIDGAQIAAETSDTVVLETTDTFILGADAGGANDYNGVMEEFRIFSTDHSAAWVKLDYNSMGDSLVTFAAQEQAPVTADNSILFGVNF